MLPSSPHPTWNVNQVPFHPSVITMGLGSCHPYTTHGDTEPISTSGLPKESWLLLPRSAVMIDPP